MKPLKLVIFERDEDGNYRDAGGWAYDEYDIDVHGQQKRLTDAELAAEYWLQYSVYTREASNLVYCQPIHLDAARESFRREERRTETMHRFATHPHYDEACL